MRQMAEDKKCTSRDFHAELPIRPANSKRAKLPRRAKRLLSGTKLQATRKRASIRKGYKVVSQALERKRGNVYRNTPARKGLHNQGECVGIKEMKGDVEGPVEGKTETAQRSGQDGSQDGELSMADLSWEDETEATQNSQEEESEEFPTLTPTAEDQMKTSQHTREGGLEDANLSMLIPNDDRRHSAPPNLGRDKTGDAPEEDDAMGDDSNDSDAGSVILPPGFLEPQKGRDVYALYLRKQIIRTHHSHKARDDQGQIRTTTLGIYEYFGDASNEVC